MGLLERIEETYSEMSGSQQKVARTICLNPKDFLFDSLAVFSRKADSSEATVVRFAQQLGYRGYTDLQDSLRDEARIDWVSGKPDSKADPGGVGEATKSAEKKIEDMVRSLDEDVLNGASDLLMEAESVLIIGYMDAFGVGAQALHSLDGIRDNVSFSRLLLETNEVFRHIHNSSVIIAISFTPHYKFTYELLKLAGERHCPMVLMCDNAMNPLAGFADYVLCAGECGEKDSVLMDMSAPSHLLYLLAKRMESRHSRRVKAFQERTLRRHEVFLP
jgi:DNA-binding MurR/RpiR family transcriptional regulator